MLVLRHGHPGGKKKQYCLDLDTPVKPEYDMVGCLDLDYRVKPDNDNKKSCLTWIIGSSRSMTIRKGVLPGLSGQAR